MCIHAADCRCRSHPPCSSRILSTLVPRPPDHSVLQVFAVFPLSQPVRLTVFDHPQESCSGFTKVYACSDNGLTGVDCLYLCLCHSSVLVFAAVAARTFPRQHLRRRPRWRRELLPLRGTAAYITCTCSAMRACFATITAMDLLRQAVSCHITRPWHMLP